MGKYQHSLARRRSPLFVREWSSETLHAVAGRLRRDACSQGLTRGQECLWDWVISELEYRFRHRSTQWPWCACELCVPPFPDEAFPLD